MRQGLQKSIRRGSLRPRRVTCLEAGKIRRAALLAVLCVAAEAVQGVVAMKPCVLPAPAVTLFLIRHGESRHNSAARSFDLAELVGQQDHGLSVRGAAQCLKLAEKIAARRDGAGADDECEAADYERLFHPETPLTCSSLTRAIQTAVLALAPLPSLAARGLSALPDAREKGGPGGPIFSADCIAAGRAELMPRVATALRWIARQDDTEKRGLHIAGLGLHQEKSAEAVQLESRARSRAETAADDIEAGAVKIHVDRVAEAKPQRLNWLVSALSNAGARNRARYQVVPVQRVVAVSPQGLTSAHAAAGERDEGDGIRRTG